MAKWLVFLPGRLDRQSGKAQDSANFFFVCSFVFPGAPNNQLTTSPAVARFGPYEVNTQSGEMREVRHRSSWANSLSSHPRPTDGRQGDLVTREELRSKLW